MVTEKSDQAEAYVTLAAVWLAARTILERTQYGLMLRVDLPDARSIEKLASV